MKKTAIVVVLVISLAFLGCAGMSDTEQRALSGAAIGAGAGALAGCTLPLTHHHCHRHRSPTMMTPLTRTMTRSLCP